MPDFFFIMKQIPLTQGKFALVDDEDYEELSKLKWHLHKGKSVFYAATNAKDESGKWKLFLMHRVILKLTNPNIKCDHKDGNGLNNQNSNIRICNLCENARNSRLPKNNKSGYKGVSFNHRLNKFMSTIGCNSKKIHIGYFDNKKDAALAYDIAARHFHGEFSRLNFPDIVTYSEHILKATSWAFSDKRLRPNNTSGFRGVHLFKRDNIWVAQITVRGKTVSLGRFETSLDAAKAYDDAARKHFSNKAKLNFP